MKYMLYTIWQNIKNTDKKDIPPQYEVCGPAFLSFVFYAMYAIIIGCVYSGIELLYIVAFFAYLISLLMHLGFLGTGCFKYYSYYMMVVYKYNIVVFVSKYVFYLLCAYIFNNYQGALAKDKCIFTLLVECIFIIGTILIYKKQYNILKNINVRMISNLKKEYYLSYSKEEILHINKAMDIYNKGFSKDTAINVAIITLLASAKLWIPACICTVIVYIRMFKKYMYTFEVVYKNKAKAMNIFCNSIAIIGQLLIIMCMTNIIDIFLYKLIGWIGFYMLSYIPFMAYYLKLNGMYRRSQCNDDL